jgi:hypothetical protein
LPWAHCGVRGLRLSLPCLCVGPGAVGPVQPLSGRLMRPRRQAADRQVREHSSSKTNPVHVVYLAVATRLLLMFLADAFLLSCQSARPRYISIRVYNILCIPVTMFVCFSVYCISVCLVVFRHDAIISMNLKGLCHEMNNCIGW